MFAFTEQVGLGWGWGGDVHVLRTCTHEQMLDRIWHHVKKCIPRTLKNRDPQGYLNQKDLMQNVHRWQWRRSCDNDLFTSLGQAWVEGGKSCADSLRNFCPEKTPDAPKMLAAVAKRTKRTLFDEPYISLASSSNKSKNKKPKNTQFLQVCIRNSG